VDDSRSLRVVGHLEKRKNRLTEDGLVYSVEILDGCVADVRLAEVVAIRAQKVGIELEMLVVEQTADALDSLLVHERQPVVDGVVRGRVAVVSRSARAIDDRLIWGSWRESVRLWRGGHECPIDGSWCCQDFVAWPSKWGQVS
jgi:hypothetical protein